MADEQIKNINGFAHAWCASRGLRCGTEIVEDIVQEAHVAALEYDNDRDAIVRAMNRVRMREYRTHATLSAVGIEGGDIPVYTTAKGMRPDDMGLHWDGYHGWCGDDVA